MGHKDTEIKWYGSRSYIDKKYADVYQNMFQIVDDICKDDNMEELADKVDVIFTATPQGFCASSFACTSNQFLILLFVSRTPEGADTVLLRCPVPGQRTGVNPCCPHRVYSCIPYGVHYSTHSHCCKVSN